MIVVRDNGQMYSSHAVQFIELPPLDTLTYDLREVLEYRVYGSDEPKVIATAEAFEWLHPGPVPLRAWLAEFYGDIQFDDEHAEIAARARDMIAALDLRERLK